MITFKKASSYGFCREFWPGVLHFSDGFFCRNLVAASVMSRSKQQQASSTNRQRMALRPETPAMQPPHPNTLPKERFPGGELPEYIQMPKPRLPREEQQDAYLRDRELDPKLYYPPDVDRPLNQHYDEETFRMDIQALIDAREGR